MSINEPNPALYRELCVAVPQSEAEANAQRFFDGLATLRRDCHMTDVYVVLRLPITTEDGREGIVHTSLSFGDALLCEEMAAWALGKESARRQARIGELLATGPRNKGER